MSSGEYAVAVRVAVPGADERPSLGGAPDVAGDPPAIAWTDDGWRRCTACPAGRCNARGAPGDDGESGGGAVVATCTPVPAEDRLRVLG